MSKHSDHRQALSAVRRSRENCESGFGEGKNANYCTTVDDFPDIFSLTIHKCKNEKAVPYNFIVFNFR